MRPLATSLMSLSLGVALLAAGCGRGSNPTNAVAQVRRPRRVAPVVERCREPAPAPAWEVASPPPTGGSLSCGGDNPLTGSLPVEGVLDASHRGQGVYGLPAH